MFHYPRWSVAMTGVCAFQAAAPRNFLALPDFSKIADCFPLVCLKFFPFD
jgi:hypothetical protein